MPLGVSLHPERVQVWRANRPIGQRISGLPCFACDPVSRQTKGPPPSLGRSGRRSHGLGSPGSRRAGGRTPSHELRWCLPTMGVDPRFQGGAMAPPCWISVFGSSVKTALAPISDPPILPALRSVKASGSKFSARPSLEIRRCQRACSAHLREVAHQSQLTTRALRHMIDCACPMEGGRGLGDPSTFARTSPSPRSGEDKV